MFLIDTSAWILHFNKTDPFHLDEAVRPEEIFISPPIYQEILQGVRADSAYRTVRELLLSCSIIDNPLPLKRYEEAAELYKIGRKTRITIRSGTDCLIAASAVEHGLNVLHRARDYSLIARFSALHEQSI